MKGSVLYRVKIIGPSTLDIFDGAKSKVPVMRFKPLAEGEQFDFRTHPMGHYFAHSIYIRCQNEPVVWARGGSIYWNGKRLKNQDSYQDLADLADGVYKNLN